jgi:hypothetical protein
MRLRTHPPSQTPARRGFQGVKKNRKKLLDMESETPLDGEALRHHARADVSQRS